MKRFVSAGSKFTIHPFKSLHAKHLLPLSPSDYMARFGLDFVILGIACFAVLANFTINAHASDLEKSNDSVIFSFLQDHPDMNGTLLANNGTTTILARADQWVPTAQAQASFTSATNITGASGELSLTTIQDDVIIKTSPAHTQTFMYAEEIVYTVQSGDTLSAIATRFSITEQTIRLVNKLDSSYVLKPGHQLKIPPTNGVYHTLKAGETLDGVAKKYVASVDDIMDVNDIEIAESVAEGAEIFVPLSANALPKPQAPATPRYATNTGATQIALKQTSAPENFVGGSDFMWPTPVRNITQGFHKLHSGLDISNSQKVSIYSAADGFVELSGWRAGYGNTVIINHGNGIKTLYGHASQIFVKAGEQVTKGQEIAKQGNTGRVRGATGIHLHFEVIKNGVKVNPLSYVKP